MLLHLGIYTFRTVITFRTSTDVTYGNNVAKEPLSSVSLRLSHFDIFWSDTRKNDL